jgi:hypothetical protein
MAASEKDSVQDVQISTLKESMEDLKNTVSAGFAEAKSERKELSEKVTDVEKELERFKASSRTWYIAFGVITTVLLIIAAFLAIK